MPPRKKPFAATAKTFHLPFLYQTRTILRFRPPTKPLRRPFSTSRSRCAADTSMPSPRDTTPSHGSPPQSDTLSFLRLKAAEAKKGLAQARAPPTTITSTERKVFNNIFTSIGGKGEAKKNDLVSQSSHNEREKDLDHENILSIFSSAVTNQKKALGDADHRAEIGGGEPNLIGGSILQDYQQRIDRYPRSLRKVARRAVLSAAAATTTSTAPPSSQNASQFPTTLLPARPSPSTFTPPQDDSDHGDEIPKPDSESPLSSLFVPEPQLQTLSAAIGGTQKFPSPWSADEDEAPQTMEARDIIDEDQRQQDHWGQDLQDRVAKISQSEMQKISILLKQSVERGEEGDFGLWRVCVRHVFPMVDLLTPIDILDVVVNKADRIDKHAAKSTKKSVVLPKDVPPLAVLTTLYPSILLLALRLLIAHFPTSPLCLALLPHIRTLGPMSYVLGASVHLYNALLKLRFDVYSDLGAMDRLLEDMECGGVEFDNMTWRLLDEVEWERWQDISDANSSIDDNLLGGGVGKGRGQAWWERPVQVRRFARIKEWKRIVAQRLTERGLGDEISEREYGHVGARDDGAGGASMRVERDNGNNDRVVWL